MLRRQLCEAVFVAALLSGACERAGEKQDPGAGGAENAGSGGRTPQAGSATSGTSGAGHSGATSSGGTGGAAGVGGSNGAGRGGSSAAGDAGRGAAAGSDAGRGAIGGAAGDGGASGSGGDAGDDALAGSGNDAGAGGESSGEPGECETPFVTVDISRLDSVQTLERYDVTGNTENAIRQSLDANRPSDYDAYTTWYISWQFGDCDGGGLVVNVNVTYQIPQWIAPNDAAPELVASWNAYESALFCHEYGHAKLGLEAANDIYTALDDIDSGGDCSTQQTMADARFSAILDDYLAREIQYDTETNHGATMGAVFPPP